MSLWGAIGNAVGSLGSIGSRGTPGIRDPRGDFLRKIRNQNRTANIRAPTRFKSRSSAMAHGIPGIPTGGLGVRRGNVVGDIVRDVGRGVVERLPGIAIDAATGFIQRRLNPSERPSDVVPSDTNVVPGDFSPVVANCPDGSASVMGRCVDFIPGGAVSGGGLVLNTGETVNGRYGSAVVPAQVQSSTRRCPRGEVLANDGLCYNKRNLRTSDREWIPGRKPLLTGGDLNAIATASRAAKKMQRQAKRLQKLGLMPKPKNLAARRASPRHLTGPVHTP